jgi:plasmid stabilization system protein ParE
MTYEVLVSPSALDDMRGILRYIAENLSAPESALKILDSIETAIRSLSESPKIYAVVSDERLSALGYRKLCVENYLVFFIINDSQKTVEVDRVLYTRRDWQQIL